MRLLAVHLQDFRNVLEAHLQFTTGGQYFLGTNGQGKTNLLEAIALLSAVRSFRTPNRRSLPRWDGPGQAALRFELECEKFGGTEVEIRIEAGRARVMIDGETVPRMSDFVGRFPVIALSSHDLGIVRGSPGDRRRFLDMAIANVDGSYLDALRRYDSTLRERNTLLKNESADSLFAAFERVLAEAAFAVETIRKRVLDEWIPIFQAHYGQFAPADELPGIALDPDFEAESVSDFADLYEKSRSRDRHYGSTSRGPHRDDLKFEIRERDSREFGSEGQQRSLVLAARLTQVSWSQMQTQVHPVVVADDILGELDPERRRQLWTAMPGEVQVFASGTRPPAQDSPFAWNTWKVSDGRFFLEARA